LKIKVIIPDSNNIQPYRLSARKKKRISKSEKWSLVIGYWRSRREEVEEKETMEVLSRSRVIVSIIIAII
jgi:hypothetical protein